MLMIELLPQDHEIVKVSNVKGKDTEVITSYSGLYLTPIGRVRVLCRKYAQTTHFSVLPLDGTVWDWSKHLHGIVRAFALDAYEFNKDEMFLHFSVDN